MDRGARPFECAFPGCGRCFARKFDLHKHQRMHDGDDESAKKKKRKRVVQASPDAEPNEASSTTGQSKPVNGESLLPGGTRAGQGLQLRPALGTSTGMVGSPQGAPLCLNCNKTITIPVSKPALRYELKCTEDHIHSPPACFAAFNPAESLDEFLSNTDSDLKSLSLIDIGSCCQGHLPPPKGMSSQLMSPVMSGTQPTAVSAPSEAETMPGVSMPPLDLTLGAFDSNGSEATLIPLEAAMKSDMADDGKPVEALMPLPMMPSSLVTSSGGVTMKSSAPAAGRARLSTAMAGDGCVPVPTSADLALNYSKHNRSCGHLSIQHGNHRDYVVQNHLVCQDSVKKLGERQRCASKCASEVPHGPGCGHLPVRHKDHIDYVVEDNLFCQHAGWLDDVDNIELLDDDFWEFYGAIGSLNPDEQDTSNKSSVV